MLGNDTLELTMLVRRKVKVKNLCISITVFIKYHISITIGETNLCIQGPVWFFFVKHLEVGLPRKPTIQLGPDSYSKYLQKLAILERIEQSLPPRIFSGYITLLLAQTDKVIVRKLM